MPGSQASHSLAAMSAELTDTIQLGSSLRWICFTFLWLGKISCVGCKTSLNQSYLIADTLSDQVFETSVYRTIEVDSPTRGVFRSKDVPSDSPLILIESNAANQELTGTHELDLETNGVPFAREEKLDLK